MHAHEHDTTYMDSFHIYSSCNFLKYVRKSHPQTSLNVTFDIQTISGECFQDNFNYLENIGYPEFDVFNMSVCCLGYMLRYR